jgi:hypothetical protein
MWDPRNSRTNLCICSFVSTTREPCNHPFRSRCITASADPSASLASLRRALGSDIWWAGDVPPNPSYRKASTVREGGSVSAIDDFMCAPVLSHSGEPGVFAGGCRTRRSSQAKTVVKVLGIGRRSQSLKEEPCYDANLARP